GALGAATLAFPHVALPKRRDPAQRPNILYIMLDDVGREGLPFYPQFGSDQLPHGTVDAPVMTALAQDGHTRTFDMMRSTPICWGTRFETVTGNKLFELHGQSHRYAADPLQAIDPRFDRTPSDLIYSKLNGYRCGAFGKWHLALPEKLTPHHVAKSGLDEWGISFNSNYKDNVERVYYGSEWTTHEAPGATKTLPSDVFVDDAASLAARSFMARSSRGAQPWFCQLWLNLVHDPVIDLSDKSRPLTKVEKLRSMVRYTDKIIGQIIDDLKAAGEFDNTLLIIGSDNGGNGFVGGEKSDVSERGVGVPFLLRWPGMVQGGREGRIAQMTDLYPTMLQAAGTSDPRIYAKSLFPLFHDGQKGIHAFVTQSVFVGNWMVADQNFKLKTPPQCRTAAHAGSCQRVQLYDIVNDPDELEPLRGNQGGERAWKARARLSSIARDLGLQVDMVAEAQAPWSTIMPGGGHASRDIALN
ncbi:MAG: sulfatase-like hydrolase/transferase, partial [Pseudomonadota bacterium]